MIENYKNVLKKYATFNGRARRREYWYFVLANIILGVVGIILDNVLGMTISPEIPYGPFYFILLIATFIPSLAVLVRRLHDIGKSGWMFFICLIPIIGPIWLLVLLAKEGDRATNEYGPDPKSDGNDIKDHLVS
jgi:uncharacterized membrane protein YhaH (DUF805 family)